MLVPDGLLKRMAAMHGDRQELAVSLIAALSLIAAQLLAAREVCKILVEADDSGLMCDELKYAEIDEHGGFEKARACLPEPKEED